MQRINQLSDAWFKPGLQPKSGQTVCCRCKRGVEKGPLIQPCLCGHPNGYYHYICLVHRLIATADEVCGDCGCVQTHPLIIRHPFPPIRHCIESEVYLGWLAAHLDYQDYQTWAHQIGLTIEFRNINDDYEYSPGAVHIFYVNRARDIQQATINHDQQDLIREVQQQEQLEDIRQETQEISAWSERTGQMYPQVLADSIIALLHPIGDVDHARGLFENWRTRMAPWLPDPWLIEPAIDIVHQWIQNKENKVGMLMVQDEQGVQNELDEVDLWHPFEPGHWSDVIAETSTLGAAVISVLEFSFQQLDDDLLQMAAPIVLERVQSIPTIANDEDEVGLICGQVLHELDPNLTFKEIYTNIMDDYRQEVHAIVSQVLRLQFRHLPEDICRELEHFVTPHVYGVIDLNFDTKNLPKHTNFLVSNLVGHIVEEFLPGLSSYDLLPTFDDQWFVQRLRDQDLPGIRQCGGRGRRRYQSGARDHHRQPPTPPPGPSTGQIITEGVGVVIGAGLGGAGGAGLGGLSGNPAIAFGFGAAGSAGGGYYGQQVTRLLWLRYIRHNYNRHHIHH